VEAFNQFSPTYKSNTNNKSPEKIDAHFPYLLS